MSVLPFMLSMCAAPHYRDIYVLRFMREVVTQSTGLFVLFLVWRGLRKPPYVREKKCISYIANANQRALSEKIKVPLHIIYR